MMNVRIPIDKHPYPSVEKSIRRVCKELALVFNPRRGTWVIIQENDRYVPTLPALRSIPGISGRKYCKWVWVFTLWDKDGRPLSPENYHARILWALKRMSVRDHGGFSKYMDEIEEENEAERERHLKYAYGEVKGLARDAAVWKGRIISTPAGTINVDKMYSKLVPGKADDGSPCMLELD